MIEEQSGRAGKFVIYILLIIGLLWAFGFIVVSTINYVSLSNSQKWENVTIDRSQRDYYSDLVMIPGISEHFKIAAARGMRDPEYRIETDSYETIEELFAMMPFEDDEARGLAIEGTLNMPIGIPSKLDDEQINELYDARDLPITDTDENGERVTYFYYPHHNYVALSDDGYRFIFIVETM